MSRGWRRHQYLDPLSQFVLELVPQYYIGIKLGFLKKPDQGSPDHQTKDQGSV